jgi:3-hydroxyacyl-[acyl-carrier-protein] dehydratase
MRWFWVDRFETFNRCRDATSIKAVTLAEEHLHDHFPGLPVMPNSLVIEGIAQTAGLLIADAIDFRRQVVLAKVSKAVFFSDAIPGDTLRYHAEILEINESGAMARATSRIGDRVQAEVDLVFGLLLEGEVVPKLMSRDTLMLWFDHLHVFDVAIDVDGSPVPRGRIPSERA